MDIFALDTTAAANAGSDLALRGPTGAALLKPDKTPVTIRLLGSDSDVYQRISNQQTNQGLRKGFRPGAITAEGALADEIELLAQVTTGWDGLEDQGQPYPFSTENARKLYQVKFIREQIREFVNDRGNFSKASPQT